jgi:hypothetical protein
MLTASIMALTNVPAGKHQTIRRNIPEESRLYPTRI